MFAGVSQLSRWRKRFALLAVAVLAVTLLGVLLASCGGGTSSTTAGGGSVTTAGTSSTTSGGSSTSAAAGGTQVSIKNFAFNPATITVKAGDTVTWTNNDSTDHTVTADGNQFDSGKLAPGQTFSFTFKNAGSVGYHCSIHPNMKATVTVQ